MQRRVCVRWSSEGGGGEDGKSSEGGGGEDGKSSEGGGGEDGKGQKRSGVVETFLRNVQQGLRRNQEMQESLKGLREERERMERSYVLQRWREQLGESWEGVREGGRRGWELVRRGWGRTREGLDKVCHVLSPAIYITSLWPDCVRSE